MLIVAALASSGALDGLFSRLFSRLFSGLLNGPVATIRGAFGEKRSTAEGGESKAS